MHAMHGHSIRRLAAIAGVVLAVGVAPAQTFGPGMNPIMTLDPNRGLSRRPLPTGAGQASAIHAARMCMIREHRTYPD